MKSLTVFDLVFMCVIGAVVVSGSSNALIAARWSRHAGKLAKRYRAAHRALDQDAQYQLDAGVASQIRPVEAYPDGENAVTQLRPSDYRRLFVFIDDSYGAVLYHAVFTALMLVYLLIFVGLVGLPFGIAMVLGGAGLATRDDTTKFALDYLKTWLEEDSAPKNPQKEPLGNMAKKLLSLMRISSLFALVVELTLGLMTQLVSGKSSLNIITVLVAAATMAITALILRRDERRRAVMPRYLPRVPNTGID